MKKKERETENKRGLTPEKLREFKGFENVSDEEAKEIIYSIKEFSIIAYHHYIKTRNKKS